MFYYSECCHFTLEMATEICEKCAQLLKDFDAHVKRLSAEFVLKIKECIKALSRCNCLRKKRASSESYTSEQHQRQAARLLLDHLDTVEAPLPVAILEPYTALLLSNDLEVQRTTSLSLVHLLVKNKDSNREAIMSADWVIPLLVLAKCYDPQVQKNAVWDHLNLKQSECITSLQMPSNPFRECCDPGAADSWTVCCL
ncbi:hypothetical protein J4Q44_G00226900 [Coregonus suidteri]|uniref:Uncharacterized protein n=1 Tax=Coregonus suidteri TaxID=861788 RepID=A0AAN8LFI3_9TELE